MQRRFPLACLSPPPSPLSMSSPASPKTIALRLGLDVKELDKSCDEALLPSLATFVHPLVPIDLDDIDSENAGLSEPTKRLASLHKWKVKCGARATYGELITSLLKNGDVQNAENVCRQIMINIKHSGERHNEECTPGSLKSSDTSIESKTKMQVTIVGSATMELEQAFRLMTIELAMKLSEEECHRIAYVACVDKIVPPEHRTDFRLYLLNTLESRGQIGPLKLQFLEDILVSIGRNDVLDLISKYKKKSIYKEAKKKKKQRKSKKQQDQTVESLSAVHQYEETYVTFCTQFAQMARSMRSALETGEVAKMKDAFSRVVSNGDAVIRTLKKNLSLAGVNSDSVCTSSSRDSSRMVSPTSTPPRVKMELLNDDPNDTVVEAEGLSSDQSPCTESTQATAPAQVPCQASQSHIPGIPVFVPSQRMSQIGDSTSDDMDNTGDGTGTGDSGLGNMEFHIPSMESLDQIASPGPDPWQQDTCNDIDNGDINDQIQTSRINTISQAPAFLPKPKTDLQSDIDNRNHHTFNMLPSVSTYYGCSSNITSVPFLSEVEILICDSFGGEYHTSDHGITLRIPEGAVPAGQIAHLEVAVALYGPFQFPGGSCPISSILWLCIQENINLRKPIDIILPHFLTSINKNDIENLGINFAKADHEQYIADASGRNQYVFSPLEAGFTAYKEGNQNYGILSTQHCCFFCITSKNPIDPDFALKAGYFLWCIEKPFSYLLPSICRDTLLFCATYCLPTCRKALKSQYTEKEGYFVRKPRLFKFKDLGGGMEPCLSIKVKDEVCVVAAVPENKQIKASEVYFGDEKRNKLELLHEEKAYPPSVDLTLEVSESHSTLLFIKFDGLTANSNMNMEIMLPLASAGNGQPGPSLPAIESQWSSTEKPRLKTLLEELYMTVASKWEDVGILLDIEPESLESLKTAENNSSQSRLREMLKIWLKKINPPPSWSAIADALQSLGDEQLAQNLRSKYLK